MTHTSTEQLRQILDLVLIELDRMAIPIAYMQEIDRKGKAFIEQAALEYQAREPIAYAVYDIKHGGSASLHLASQHSEHGDAEQYKLVPLYAD